LSSEESKKNDSERCTKALDTLSSYLAKLVLALFITLLISQALLQNDDIRQLLVSVERMEGVRLN